MIRQLAHCPYCQGCEIALNESFDVVPNPDGQPPGPCPHLVWVEGRYTQWGLSLLPGRKTKLARMIGSTEFEWLHPALSGRDDAGEMRTYLKELAGSGAGWEGAPAVPHQVRPMAREQRKTDADGREYPDWEVEGSAVYAADPAAFLAALPAMLERQAGPWADLTDSAPG